MAKFWLFGYDQFYPDGGMNDFQGAFDTLEEAKAFADEPHFEDGRKKAASQFYDIYTVEDNLPALVLYKDGDEWHQPPKPQWWEKED